MEEEISQKYIDESRQGEALLMPKEEPNSTLKRKLYLESYGCQMNFADSEIVASIMKENGFITTNSAQEADAIFINTCAIRDNAEQRVRKRLQQFNVMKKENPKLMIGVLGCMAERLKKKFLEEEKIVDLVVGPDAYRNLPNLLLDIEDGQKAVNVFLSREETYADISPVRLDSNGIAAFITIMRGCDNMCSFCVVPYTRGRERSRDVESIVNEAKDLFLKGYREVTLLGQNVDSYKYIDNKTGLICSFSDLMVEVAKISPLLRVRFSTSHPKDITEDVMIAMKSFHNICDYIHLPVQSGNSRILEKMNRTYTREWYLDKIKMIRGYVPSIAISTDMIVGFCSESEQDHKDSLSIMEAVQFDFAYMFTYSERPGTPAAKKYADDVPEEIKNERLTEMIAFQREINYKSNQANVGNIYEVLIEGESKRSDVHFKGRTTHNKMVILPKGHYQKGDYVMCEIIDCTSGTLIGEVIGYADIQIQDEILNQGSTL